VIINTENLTLANIQETRKAILELPQSVERAKLLIENDVCLINAQEIENPVMTVTSDELILDSIVPETADSLLKSASVDLADDDAVQAGLDAAANFNLSHDLGELGKPSILDVIIEEIKKAYKQGKKCHIVCLGLSEMKALENIIRQTRSFVSFNNEVDNSSVSFNVADVQILGCSVIKYPADSFLEVF
jgi:hypothetical protein